MAWMLALPAPHPALIRALRSFHRPGGYRGFRARPFLSAPHSPILWPMHPLVSQFSPAGARSVIELSLCRRKVLVSVREGVAKGALRYGCEQRGRPEVSFRRGEALRTGHPVSRGIEVRPGLVAWGTRLRRASSSPAYPSGDSLGANFPVGNLKSWTLNEIPLTPVPSGKISWARARGDSGFHR
jgi:hypothetical protein